MSGARTVADTFLRTLRARGVEWIFGNAGTDFAPLIEAYAAAEANGTAEDLPTAAEILHETVAVAMAHGYWLVTGRPQCAMVHVNVGTANALMGIMNASRDSVPILFASGRTPLTETGRLGSRNAPIHWGQEMFDQGGMLREFVKWDYELAMPEQIVDVVDRGLAIAQSEPQGPVYLSLPRELLADVVADAETGAEPAVTVPTKPHPDPAGIDRVTAMIADADSPLIISTGGDAALFDVLGPFAERHAIPVVQFWRTRTAIAGDHPMFAGEAPRELLAEADMVLVLDTLVPWVPATATIRPDAKVVSIGPDPLFTDTPMRSFPSAINLTADAAVSVAELGRALDVIDHAEQPDVVERRRQLTSRLVERRVRELAAGEEPGGTPMAPSFLSRTLAKVIGSDAVVINELGLPTAMLEPTRHDSLFGPSIAGGLGWGGGAALGAKLAAGDRLVVWTTGDGSYVFSNPTAVHHAAASLGLGLLTIVADNRVWNAVRRSTIAVYPEGYAATSPIIPLSSLEPAPDYTKIVEAYGGHGEHVEDPADLRSALERAVEICAAGRQALVSVHVSHPDFRL